LASESFVTPAGTPAPDDDGRDVIRQGHRWIGVVFVESDDQQRIIGPAAQAA